MYDFDVITDDLVSSLELFETSHRKFKKNFRIPDSRATIPLHNRFDLHYNHSSIKITDDQGYGILTLETTRSPPHLNSWVDLGEDDLGIRKGRDLLMIHGDEYFFNAETQMIYHKDGSYSTDSIEEFHFQMSTLHDILTVKEYQQSFAIFTKVHQKMNYFDTVHMETYNINKSLIQQFTKRLF